MGREEHAALRALAADQLGLFATRQAGECGVSRRSLGQLLASGAVASLHRGVYRFTGNHLSRDAEILAAVLAAGPDAVASHETALALHGLRPAGEVGAPIEVCSPTLWHPLVPTITVHRTRRLPPCDRTTIGPIPVTTGARTLVDLAGRYERHEFTRLLDDAVCAGVALRWTVYGRARALRNGRAGVGLVVSLTHPEAAGEFRSWLERRASYSYDTYGVPQPQWNVRRYDDEGLIGVVDCYWPDANLVVELEGLRFHTSPSQRRQDACRFNRLSAQSRVLRFTWQDVVEQPEAMCSLVRSTLGVATCAPNR